MQPAPFTRLLIAMLLLTGGMAAELYGQNVPSAAVRSAAQTSGRASSTAESTTTLPKRSRNSETPLPPAGNETRRNNTGSSPWTTFGILAVMIVAVVSIARLWKKHGPMSSSALPPEAVELLGRKMIDQRNVIHLVRVGARIVIIGASPQGLATLAEVTDPVEVDVLAGLCQRRQGDAAKAQSFRTLFNTQPSLNADTATTGAVVGSQRAAARFERAPRPFPTHSAALPNEGEYIGGVHE